MSSTDIGAQALAWALDEAGKQAFGEEFGVSVTWVPQVVQGMGPAGPMPQAVPVWQLLITCRNPELGHGPLFHMVPLVEQPQALALDIRPREDVVRAKVTEGLRLLRDLAASKLAGTNGKAPAGLAKGRG